MSVIYKNGTYYGAGGGGEGADTEIIAAKSADSAVEIGSDTDYSTTEKIVGTWIDGKPIWQKTLHLTNVSIGTSLVNIGDLSGLNIETGTIVDFMAVDSEGYVSCGGYFSTTLRVPNDNIGVKKSAATTTTTYPDVYITIQYTKVS